MYDLDFNAAKMFSEKALKQFFQDRSSIAALKSMIELVRTLLLYVSLLFENKDEFIRTFYVTINVEALMGNCSDFTAVWVIGPIRLIYLRR